MHSQSQVYHQSEEYRRHQNVQDRWRSPRRSRHRCHQDRFQRHLLQQQAATHPCVLARHLCLAMRFSSTPSQVVVSARWGLEVALVAVLSPALACNHLMQASVQQLCRGMVLFPSLTQLLLQPLRRQYAMVECQCN